VSEEKKPYPFFVLRAWMDQLAQKPGLNTTDRLVFVAIASHTDPDGFCFPSDETLAEHTGLKVVSHLASRKRLRKAGVIDWTTHGHNGSSNLYRILLSAERTAPASGVLHPRAAMQPRQPARYQPHQPAR
jgi:hypothetical protein